jgi:hypothetical protein
MRTASKVGCGKSRKGPFLSASISFSFTKNLPNIVRLRQLMRRVHFFFFYVRTVQKHNLFPMLPHHHHYSPIYQARPPSSVPRDNDDDDNDNANEGTPAVLRPVLLAFDEEACGEQKANVALQDITGVVLQEYGKQSAGASYLKFRFELPTALGTWVLAADSEIERARWLDELQRLGLDLKDKRPSAQQWDHEGLLETRLAIATLGWKSRYIRLRGHEFIVFREQSSQVVKEIVRRQNRTLHPSHSCTVCLDATAGFFVFVRP